jgi:hypothetical protein
MIDDSYADAKGVKRAAQIAATALAKKKAFFGVPRH